MPETTEETIRIALQSGDDPRLKDRKEVFDLADLAQMMLSLTKDYHAWLVVEYPDAAKKDKRSGLRLNLYDVDEGSIGLILGVIGKAPLLFKMKKWAQNLNHNFRILSNNKLPEELPLDRARTLKNITNITNNYYGPFINKIENDRYSHSDISTINENLGRYINETQYEDLRGVFMQFVRIDGRDGAKQGKHEHVVIDRIDENPFPLRLSIAFASFKTELLQKKGDNPFTKKYEVNIRVIRDREDNIIEYELLDVLGTFE